MGRLLKYIEQRIETLKSYNQMSSLAEGIALDATIKEMQSIMEEARRITMTDMFVLHAAVGGKFFIYADAISHVIQVPSGDISVQLCTIVTRMGVPIEVKHSAFDILRKLQEIGVNFHEP